MRANINTSTKLTASRPLVHFGRRTLAKEAMMEWIHMVEIVLYLALAIILLCHLVAA
jgi:hypothetical protein